MAAKLGVRPVAVASSPDGSGADDDPERPEGRSLMRLVTAEVSTPNRARTIMTWPS